MRRAGGGEGRAGLPRRSHLLPLALPREHATPHIINDIRDLA